MFIVYYSINRFHLFPLDKGHRIFDDQRTIDNYRLSLLLKLDVKNAPALIKKAIDMGLIN